MVSVRPYIRPSVQNKPIKELNHFQASALVGAWAWISVRLKSCDYYFYKWCLKSWTTKSWIDPLGLLEITISTRVVRTTYVHFTISKVNKTPLVQTVRLAAWIIYDSRYVGNWACSDKSVRVSKSSKTKTSVKWNNDRYCWNCGLVEWIIDASRRDGNLSTRPIYSPGL